MNLQQVQAAMMVGGQSGRCLHVYVFRLHGKISCTHCGQQPDIYIVNEAHTEHMEIVAYLERRHQAQCDALAKLHEAEESVLKARVRVLEGERDDLRKAYNSAAARLGTAWDTARVLRTKVGDLIEQLVGTDPPKVG